VGFFVRQSSGRRTAFAARAWAICASPRLGAAVRGLRVFRLLMASPISPRRPCGRRCDRRPRDDRAPRASADALRRATCEGFPIRRPARAPPRRACLSRPGRRLAGRVDD
jgi:hypothetical protein